MKLSIIIPVYNVEKYLLKCLTSIIESKNQEFEVILINDGSIDNSDKICKVFQKRDKRIKYISKENEGCSRSRNLGIEKAQGKYIWFIDSDDFIEKGSIDKIMEILKEKIGILIFGYNKIYENGQIEKRIPNLNNDIRDVYKQLSFFNSPWNKIYNTKIIKKNKIKFMEESHMGEDMNFNFKFFYYVREYEIRTLRESLYNYNFTLGVTSNFSKRMEIFKSFDDIVEFYKKVEKFEEIRKILEKYYRLHAIKFVYDAIITEKRKNINFDAKEAILNLYQNLKKRKIIFKNDFLFFQMIYLLKFIIYPGYYYLKDFKKGK